MHGQLLNGSCLRNGDRGSRLLSPKSELFVGGKTVGQMAGNGGQVVAGKEDVMGSVTIGIEIVDDELDGLEKDEVVVNGISDDGTEVVDSIMVDGISVVGESVVMSG